MTPESRAKAARNMQPKEPVGCNIVLREVETPRPKYWRKSKPLPTGWELSINGTAIPGLQGFTCGVTNGFPGLIEIELDADSIQVLPLSRNGGKA